MTKIRKTMLVTRKKLFENIYVLLNGVWTLPCIFLIIILSRFIDIQFRAIYCSKLGHFILDGAEEYNYYKLYQNRKILYYFSNPKAISNYQWAKMLQRNMPIYPFFGHKVGKWLGIFPGLTKLNSKGTSATTNKNSRFLKNKDYGKSLELKFTYNENLQGFEWLRSIGWRDGDYLICLLVRDNSFSETDPNNNGNLHVISSNEYRNSNIENFLESINWLLQQNVFVIRMGRITEKSVEIDNPRFFDYSKYSKQTDFLDIWLFANCDGIISTSTGPDALGCIYQIPLLLVDMLPLNGTFTFSNCITVPKKLIWEKNGKPLNLREILDSSWSLDKRLGPNLNSNIYDYQKRGIKISDLTSLELLKATQEFWARIKGTHNSSDTDLILQNKFWTAFKSHPDYKYNHNWKHPKAFVGEDWLRSQEEDFFE
jgi:putative glycosyltransferase (TIGR04372 family)